MVDTIVGIGSRLSEDNPEVGNTSEYPRNEQSSSFTQNSDFDSMQTIRKAFQNQNISGKSIDIIMGSWLHSTQKQYASFIKRWLFYCSERQIDAFHAPLNEVLDFLTDLFESGLSYSALNTARSALSAIGITINGFLVGSHPVIIRYMKGVYNKRPSTPRYTELWDVAVVLRYLQTLSPVKELSLKLLTFKLVMLISLTLACRTQSLHLLDLRGMIKKKDSYTLLYRNLLKQCRPGKDNSVAILKSYPPDRRLCVNFVLKEYLKRTETLRGNSTELFISYMKPYKPVSRETISRWLRTVLCSAGINCDMFKTHSIRGAASSKAKMNSVPVDHILKTAGWSNTKTFGKFYDKPVVQEVSFAHGVLKL